MRGVMKVAALALFAFLVGSPRTVEPLPPPPQAEGAPFLPVRAFADAPACIAHLRVFVRESAPPAFDAAAGPYEVAPGDTRAHRIKARDWGHEIEEFRCWDAALSSRRWTHSMSEVKPFTMEDIGRMSFPAE